MNEEKNNRREFLIRSGSLAGLTWATLNAPALMAAAEAAAEQRAKGSRWVKLSPEQVTTLTAVVDQIIPSDDMPGASEMGAVFFIDQALAGFMSGMADQVTEGLADLESRVQQAFPGSDGFARLTFTQKRAQLEAIEESPFFNSLIFLTHCGIFSMPSLGGNTLKAGWDLIGFNDQHAWQPPFGFYDVQAAATESKNGG